MALIRCPECGREVSDRAVACPNCGMPVSEMMVKPQYCHSCGAPLTKDALFCTECGTKVISSPDIPLPQSPHQATKPMPPSPPVTPEPRVSAKAEKPAQHTPPPPPVTSATPATPDTPDTQAAPETKAPAAAPIEKVEMPHSIKPKSAPSPNLTGKAGERRAKALARKEAQSKDGKDIPGKPGSAQKTPARSTETPAPAQPKRQTGEKPAETADMPAIVTPKAAPSIPPVKNSGGKPAPHTRKPAGKPQQPAKAEPVTKPGIGPSTADPAPIAQTPTDNATAVDDSQFYEPYDDKYQPFEQQLAQNKQKQKKNIIMASVIICTIAVIGICVWIFASVDDEQTTTEVVEISHTKTPAPQWIQGEWHCHGSAFIDGKQTMVNSSMTIKGDSVTISDYLGKSVEGQCHVEGTDLVCFPADGNEIRLAISEENRTIEYAGGLIYKRGIASGSATAKPAQEKPSATVNAKGNKSKAATATDKKTKKQKYSKSKPGNNKTSKPDNSYTSKKRSSSMPLLLIL